MLVFGNPLYKFNKLSVNVQAGRGAKLRGRGGPAEDVDSPAAESLSSPETSRYVHAKEVFSD